MIEAASNPYVVATNGTASASGPAAWQLTDPTNPWFGLGGEIGDGCTGLVTPSDGHAVTRVWSDAAASAGDDPRVPAGAPMFGAAPAVAIAAGATVRVQITGWSAGRVDPWRLAAASGPFVTSGFVPIASVDPDVVDDATAATLSISAPAGTPSGSTGIVFLAPEPAGTPLALSSRRIWPVLVTVP